MTRTVNGIRIGKADVAPDQASHQAGVPEGNSSGNFERMAGFYTENGMAKAKGARSTGINPRRKEPIHPDSPTLTPA